MQKKFNNIDEYISTFPVEIQAKLNEIRETIKKAVPEAEETISYQMPAFKYKKILVYFAAFKNHIGFFPTSSGIEAFKDELSEYVTSKGTIRFPLNIPIPLDLINKIVKYRFNEEMIKINKKINNYLLKEIK